MHAVHTLDDLRSRPEAMLRELEQAGGPMVFTVDGKAAAVLQDAAEDERLLDLAALAAEDEAVRQGDDDVKASRRRPAPAVFAAMRRQHALSR